MPKRLSCPDPTALQRDDAAAVERVRSKLMQRIADDGRNCAAPRRRHSARHALARWLLQRANRVLGFLTRP